MKVLSIIAAVLISVGVTTPAIAQKTYLGTKAAETFVGTNGNDVFRGNGGGDTLIGGLGDDKYIVDNAKDVVVEKPGEGTDLFVTTLKGFLLPPNVENLALSGPALFARGNSLNNTITGTTSANEIDGGAGNDTLTGGGGGDVFIISSGNGNDTITDFNVSTDKIRLPAYGITSFATVQSIATQVGADTRLSFANGEFLIIKNTTKTALTESNFQLMRVTTGLTLSFSEEFDSLSLFHIKNNKAGRWNTSTFVTGDSFQINGRSIAGLKSIFVDADFAGSNPNKTALGINPFSINNGILTITTAPTPPSALKYLGNFEYTSGYLATKGSFSQKYGYFEIRSSSPPRNGLYSAFWLIPYDSTWPPELDIYEILGYDPWTVYLTTHDNVGGKNVGVGGMVTADTSQYHIYGADWGPEYVKFYIDNTLVLTQKTPPSMNKEMYLILNGGAGNANWFGTTDNTTGIGQFQIDYIRAYITNNTVSTRYGSKWATTNVYNVYTPTSGGGGGSSVGGGVSGGHGSDHTLPSGGGSGVTPPPPPTVSLQVKGTANADSLIGKRDKEELYGLDGNDTLSGGPGETKMYGGPGNDRYIVATPTHYVFESANEGSDSISSTINYTIPANVENMILTGTGNINGTGNETDNRIIGNAGNNTISGLGGNDQLDGGTDGTDILIGGTGDDLYSVNRPDTTIVEASAAGSDSIITTISLTIPANVENMTLSGTGNINGTGNELSNRIVGNAGVNVINGMGGNDTLTGKEGNDTFVFNSGFGNDTVTDFSSASDILKFSGVNMAALHKVQRGTSVVIDFGGSDTVTLLNTNLNDPLLASKITSM